MAIVSVFLYLKDSGMDTRMVIKLFQPILPITIFLTIVFAVVKGLYPEWFAHDDGDGKEKNKNIDIDDVEAKVRADRIKQMIDEKTKGEVKDILHAKTSRYTSSQTEGDVELQIPVRSDLSRKDVGFHLRSSYLCLKDTAQNSVIVEGALHSVVVLSECVWTFDEDTDGNKIISLGLTKRDLTPPGSMWRYVLESDDPMRNMPPIHAVNSHDPKAMKDMLEQVWFSCLSTFLPFPAHIYTSLLFPELSCYILNFNLISYTLTLLNRSTRKSHSRYFFNV